MCYRRRSDIRVQHLHGEVLMVDDENGLVHQLNESARFIWDQCDGKSTTTDIVERMVQAFEVDQDVASRDVESVIQQLCELNLLRK